MENFKSTKPNVEKPFQKKSKNPDCLDDIENEFKKFLSEMFNGRPETLEALLKDEFFFLTYRDAIIQNKELFNGKTVLDIGCGCAIFSMFAAQAGASRVIGVDPFEIIEDAKKIICDNQLADVITLVKGKIEEIDLPHSIDKVDIIISGWMGFSLFHESTLDDVLFARDKWLKPDGFLFPDRCSLFICGIEDKSYKEEIVDWYSKDVFGFDLSTVRKAALSEPHISIVDSKRVITTHAQLAEVDMYTYPRKDLHIKVDFQLFCRRNDYIHALATFFTVEFSKTPKKLSLSTSPQNKVTHWKQTIFYLDDYLVVKSREFVTGVIEIKSDKKEHQELDINIQLNFKGELCEVHEDNKYRLM